MVPAVEWTTEVHGEAAVLLVHGVDGVRGAVVGAVNGGDAGRGSKLQISQLALSDVNLFHFSLPTCGVLSSLPTSPLSKKKKKKTCCSLRSAVGCGPVRASASCRGEINPLHAR